MINVSPSLPYWAIWVTRGAPVHREDIILFEPPTEFWDLPDDYITNQRLGEQVAREAGFDTARIARADAAWTAGAHLSDFVAAGRHGDMGWMAETLERRLCR